MWTRHTKYLFAAALFMGCFFVLAGCENDPEVVKNLFTKKVGIEEADQVVSYLSQDGYVKAKLSAPYMKRFLQTDSSYLEFPRTLHVDFYDSLGTRESYLDADYGKYFEQDRKVLLEDSVLVINIKNGDTLRTQKLWWDQNKSEFYTDDTAYIYQPDKVILAAKGLQASQNLTNIKFFYSSGVLAVPKSDSTGGMPDTAKPPPAAAPVPQPPRDSASNTLPANADTLRNKGRLLTPFKRDSGNRPSIFRRRQ